MMAVELTLVILLILLNGFLAMSELAVVSSRPARLRALESAGVRGAATAIRLAEDPSKFLSTVQIGITLVGVLAGAFSGATLAERLSDWLTVQGVSESWADAVGLVAVVTLVTYLSLIAGELVPKQIALANPERVAAFVARPLLIIGKVFAPAVMLLDVSSRLVLKLLGREGKSKDAVTEDEIKMLVAEAESAGVLEPAEKQMISGVLRFGDRPVSALMTPRHEVDWVDLEDKQSEIRQKLAASRHSRLPVCKGSIDEVVGIVQAKDLLNAYLAGAQVDIRGHVKDAPIVHESADALEMLEVLKKATVHMALVVDEYGTFQGVVTSGDILEAIAGAFREQGEDSDQATRREDGSWLLDGSMMRDELSDLLMLPLPADQSFHTLAGFILHHLKRLPKCGDAIVVGSWRFEVIDMDGRRVDKVLASRVGGESEEGNW
ncbi:MAG TPA: hemolysin family protein [Alphaproteobacteria bacterium]|nr:hemolysin family protein [Alphaproteobacteria bacterium]